MKIEMVIIATFFFDGGYSYLVSVWGMRLDNKVEKG